MINPKITVKRNIDKLPKTFIGFSISKIVAIISDEIPIGDTLNIYRLHSIF